VQYFDAVLTPKGKQSHPKTDFRSLLPPLNDAALGVLGALPGVRRLHGPGACPRLVRAQKLCKLHAGVYAATRLRLSHPLFPPHPCSRIRVTNHAARPHRAREGIVRAHIWSNSVACVLCATRPCGKSVPHCSAPRPRPDRT
jgi:hypothetical protein